MPNWGTVQSMNTKIELSIKGRSYHGINTTGNFMLGDKAFEYYNERNVQDYIQIPWDQIDYIAASVYFNKYINRFAVFVKEKHAYFDFAARDNKAVLRVCRDHIGADKLRRSPTFGQNLRRGLKAIFGKKDGMLH